MNLDGYPDIVAGTKTDTQDTHGNIDIFYNNTLSLTRFTTVYTVASGGSIYALAARIMDGDSYPDVVTAIRTGNNSGKIEFWHNNGTMAGALTRLDEQATPGPAISLAIGNLDLGTGNDIVVGTAGAGGSTPPAVQAYFTNPLALAGAIIPNVFSWSDANAGGAVNAITVGKLECSQDRLNDDALNDIIAGTATSASTGDIVIYLNPYTATILP
jgi:hypothetical protein